MKGKQLTGLDHVVQRDSKGRPIWTSGLVGSMAHTWKITVAVAKESHMRIIGINSESITLNEQTLSYIENLVLVGDENQIKKKEELVLIFSFKEALYKCISSRIDRVLDFKKIEIVIGCTLRLILNLKVIFTSGIILKILYGIIFIVVFVSIDKACNMITISQAWIHKFASLNKFRHFA